MNILITGGTGFIGSRLAIECRQRGDRVKVLGQTHTDIEKENQKIIESAGAIVVSGSMMDRELIFEQTEGIDVVYHLAAAQHESNIADQVFRDVNVEGTRNMLDACVYHKVRRMIHGSTIGVYGHLDGQIDEQSVCHPDNIYGKTKLEGEKLVLSYRDKLPVTVIRISETYGPGDRRLLKLFKAIQNHMFFMIGSGKNLHHLIFIDDLVNGIIQSGQSDAAIGNVMILAGKNPITTDKMVQTIADELKTKVPGFKAPLSMFMMVAVILEFLLKPLGISLPFHRRRMDFFRKSFVLSGSKAFDMMNFQPQYGFREGVAATAGWYRETGKL
ncbi:MAG: NAD(P)-dependent oxidoreductase [Desulfobacterales bacterium]|nr:NAD(P)-dependent oxidoreductase [Desulfobacterales bacterium]